MAQPLHFSRPIPEYVAPTYRIGHPSWGHFVEPCPLRSIPYGTQPHMILVHGTLERTIEEKCSLYESYVLNPLRHGGLRDVNTNFRIEYPFQ